MQTIRKIKVGPFLVISSVLAVWTLLAAQPVWAHVYNTATTPSCSGLPTTTFFGSGETFGITASAPSKSDVGTKAGATTPANSGQTKYLYAKITIPALAAGELRVFDSADDGGTSVSAAALCRRGSRIASFGPSYNSSRHTTDHSVNTPAEHKTFQLRAQVSPGDEEYIVVIDPETDPATARDIHVAFHGAIESTSSLLNHQGSLDAGEVESREITITAPGLLTLETTGSTDTVGTFGMNLPVASGGSGGNFKMVLPVEAATDQALKIEGQTATTTGSFTIDMDFEVAMQNGPDSGGNAELLPNAPTWTDTALPDDTTPREGTLRIDGSADEDYFLFSPSGNGFMTIEAKNATGATKHSDTAGTLYGPDGQIATASSGGGGNHFKFRVPVDNMDYVVKVTGTTGEYALRFTFAAATKQAVTAIGSGDGSLDCPDSEGANESYEICERGGRSQQERDRYLINVTASGTLYVHSTGTTTDVIGTLYGPDGRQLGTDDNSGQGSNFSIAASVNPGLHIVEVRGATPQTEGLYGLVTNFITGTAPTDDNQVATLQARVAKLEQDLATCQGSVQTDAKGFLENPSGGGFRSGIGVISGWVCSASAVEVQIFNARGTRQHTWAVAYGTSRSDTVGQCSHISPNTGFGMTYNFNHLAEGRYTIRAYADGQQIGQAQTFEVVHLSDFASTDTDRFLRGLPAAECRVNDFPAAGEDTWLKWEQNTQNFVIEDAG